MAEKPSAQELGPPKEVEQRLSAIESELAQLRTENAIQGSMIQEYRQALDAAQFKVAVLNGQHKIAQQPTD